MNIEELNLEYKNKMDALMEEYKAKVKEVTKKEEPFVKVGRGYFTINTEFDLDDYCYTESSFDRELLESGNMFPYTKETEDKVRKEVELIAERRKLQSEMEMFARLNNDCEIDWSNNNQKKWLLCIQYDEIIIKSVSYCRAFNITYFTSEEIAKKALDKFGDRIRKLYVDMER